MNNTGKKHYQENEFRDLFSNLDDDGDDMDEETKLRFKIHEYVNRPNAFREFNRKLNNMVLGQPNLSQIAYNVFVWLRGIGDGTNTKYNAMIAAPSGSGKTETYRAINKILSEEIGDIPVIQLDMTQLTSEGFSGRNNDDFFKPLFCNSINGIGIVILDEIDKRLIPSQNTSGNNVNQDIQSQILTFIEGTRYNPKGTSLTINTNNTLFIAAGAFQSVRDKKKSEYENRTIGFDNEVKDHSASDDINVEISVEDIIELGALPELMGRFSTVINFQPLNAQVVHKIAMRYVREFENSTGFKINVTREGTKEFYEIYQSSPLGCRVLKSRIWQKLSSVLIDAEIKGMDKTKYTIVYGADRAYIRKNEPEKKKSEAVLAS